MRGPRPRATLRLAAIVALAVTLLSLAGALVQYRLVQSRLMAAAQTLLAADLDGLAALYDQRRIIALRQAIEYRAAAGATDEMLVLMDRTGRPLAGTVPAWPAALPPAGDGFGVGGAGVFAQDGQRWMGVARDLPGGFPLLVARSLAPADATLAALRRAIAGITLSMLAVGGAVGWMAARGIMARIGRLNALADRVAGGELSARLPGPRERDEFGQLETHVHTMLDRIEALNRATHRLSDTIAHEMRTPLSRIARRLDALGGDPDTVDALRAEMRNAVRVFDALLDISRAEADTGAGGLVPVDLSALTAEVVDLYDAVIDEAGMMLRSDITPALQVLGDRTLIGQALANLLDNAVKYCRPGDQITVSLTGGDAVTLTVRDTGPGLPAPLRGEVFERFTRGAGHADIAGHGLGLALVRAIALRHGAKLSLPDAEKGFVITIRWPKFAGD